ncbi:AseI [Rhodomicrobium udaipurense JA643]|uniref:Restriction endonuclease n=1 Tax=Rhodomicrobium udaipurense TaxID=1202716 RepID=A0A8I1GJ19_9HYPH|nr:hypothetical protein [Rhodomicrobium udaipurense]KAI93774.1 AseI [Rhodomicrobium udaipurense JA643]MBJ7544417.1 hypothetical protein [Rhodomicrobium udaipurense]
MDLIELKNRICSTFSGSPEDLARIVRVIDEDQAIFPFNEYEHMLALMMSGSGLTFAQYLEIRTEYVSQNPNLWIFEISAPRGFGEKFAQTYVFGKCPKLKIPSKKLHAQYVGDYDCWLDGIRIEVKASRAVDSESAEPLYMKALSRSSTRPFLMNFQQLKPQCCDVFIWVAVFRDEIVLWVMASSDVRDNSAYSRGQHRGNSGNEGQLHINQDNVGMLTPYELKDGDLEAAIRAAAARNSQ